MIDFLEKPINFHELKQLIYKWAKHEKSAEALPVN